MKTYKNLIYKNITLEKCKEIIIKASKHKTKRKGVIKVLNDLDYYSMELYKMTLNDAYLFAKSNYFKVNEYGKVRTIQSSPFFPNQCIDYLFLECGFKDIILSKINYESFGNCPKKGVHKGTKFIYKTLKNKNYKYFMKFDISKYYENIDTQILYKQIEKIIKDRKFLLLARQLLNNFGKALSIGSISSQYLALFYLTDFVNNLKIECKKNNSKLVCNYVDDFLILGNNKRKLLKILKWAKEYLSTLNLKINKKTIIYKRDKRKISMLGYRFNGKIIILRKSILKRLYKSKCKKRFWGWLKRTNCYKLKEKYYYEFRLSSNL